jgi:adenylyl-sulfate kinase
VFKQKPVTVWLTGRAGAGKTTIAYALERRLFDEGHLAYVLDGRNVRLGLSEDLLFTDEDRAENLRRAGQVARLFNEGGLIAIGAFLSPRREHRRGVREVVGQSRFVEVFLDTPEEVCRRRVAGHPDPGSLKPFGDADAPYEGYESPESPELVLPTHELAVDTCVERIVEHLREGGYLRGG